MKNNPNQLPNSATCFENQILFECDEFQILKMGKIILKNWKDRRFSEYTKLGKQGFDTWTQTVGIMAFQIEENGELFIKPNNEPIFIPTKKKSRNTLGD